MKDFAHLIRVAATFVVVTSAFLVVRSFLVPATFGKHGHYRAAAVDETKALPVHHAGRAAAKDCARCHKAQSDALRSSQHRGAWCETCHGPSRAHAEEPKSAAAMPTKPAKGSMRAFCGRCHSANVSRPKEFHQVNLQAHNPGTPCTECHNAHRPKL